MAVTLIQLLQAMMANNGSDLHICTNSVPMMRVRGDMIKINTPVMNAAEVEALMASCTSNVQKEELKKEMSIDFALAFPGTGVFRVNIYVQRHGLSLCLRALTEKPPTLEQLKLPPICRTACSYANGLVLVTGPTGSGKSTTLAAMLNHINMTVKGHILTLEDPVEFLHESQMGLVNQRALGGNFTSYASALKAALREDPDVILVGEMRDQETIELALKAAETGHLVFSTLHTNSASKTVDRIINSFPAEEQSQTRAVLSETLKMVISQKLLPSADRKRRICVHDILVNNSAAANLIREGKTFQLMTVMQTGKKEGMQVGDAVLMDLVKAGDITGEDAWEFANDKNQFAQFAPKPPSLEPTPAAPAPGGAPVKK